MKKRANGEGSVHQIHTGSWRASVTIDGRRLSKVSKNKKDVIDWLRKTNRQIDDGMSFESTQVTVGEYVEVWLNNIKSSKRMTTWSQYKQVANDHISGVGNIKLKDLRPEHIQDLYNRMIENGVGPYSVLKTRDVLHAALDQAVRLGTIPRNPVEYAQAPKAPRREMNVWTEEECNRFLASVAGHRWESLYCLALTTGARQMELLGLQWNDIDWQHNTIHIQRQLDRKKEGSEIFARLKTDYSRRTIALGDNVMSTLRERSRIQGEEMIRAGERWIDYGLVFTTRNGTPVNSRNLLDDFWACAREAGVPKIRFHDLRHTAASIMLNNGVPIIVASRRLGHSRASVTLDIYGHHVASMQNEAAKLMDSLVVPIVVAHGCSQNDD